MLQEIQGKNVVVSLGSTEFSYVVKGEVLDVSDNWLKLESKKNVEYIRINEIVKIVVS